MSARVLARSIADGIKAVRADGHTDHRVTDINTRGTALMPYLAVCHYHESVITIVDNLVSVSLWWQPSRFASTPAVSDPASAQVPAPAPLVGPDAGAVGDLSPGLTCAARTPTAPT